MFLRSTTSSAPRKLSNTDHKRRYSVADVKQRKHSHVKRRLSETVNNRLVKTEDSLSLSGSEKKLVYRFPTVYSIPENVSTVSPFAVNNSKLPLSVASKRKSRSLIQRRITLKIRGKIFQTFENTLNVFPNTLLGNKQSRQKYYDFRSKEYMFDRCCDSFDAILFYYQSKGILSKPANIDRDLFLIELEFFRITKYVDKRQERECKFIEQQQKDQELPSGKIQKVLWRALQYQEESILAHFLFYFYLCTTVIALFVFCAETVPEMQYHRLWHTLETAINIIFLVEYGSRIYSSPNTKKFLLSPNGLIDLLTIIPYFFKIMLRFVGNNHSIPLSLLTILRVVRVFKLTRYHEGLRILMMTIYKSITHLTTLFLSVLITSLAFASIMYHLESDSNGNLFSSIPASFWYTVITATGVGYGDMYPQTTLGKLVGGILSVLGVLLFCLPTPMLVNKFVECYCLKQTLASNSSARRKQIMKGMREAFLDG